MKHKLIMIGYLGGFNAYLDVDKDEAIRRYLLENEEVINIKEFEFDDEFMVYDADSIDKY